MTSKTAIMASLLAATLVMDNQPVPEYMNRERVGAPGSAARKAKRKAQKKARKRK